MVDQYLRAVLQREAVDTSASSPVLGVAYGLMPIIRHWGNQYLLNVSPSGSFAKGTANRSGTDIDLFLSLHEHTPETLKQIYETLINSLKNAGHTPHRQNVSVNIRVNGYDVDLVPAKRQNAYSTEGLVR